MTKKREHPPRYVEIILWDDHHEPEQPTWGTPTKRKELRAAEILSVGFVAVENNKIAEVVRDMAEDQLIGARLHLMKRAIIARARVRLPDAIWRRIRTWSVRTRPQPNSRAARVLMKRTRLPKGTRGRRR